MSHFAQNMQEAMNQDFTTLRVDEMVQQVERQMCAAAERIEKRPSVDGCDALKKTQSHSVVLRNKDDSGFQLMQMATGAGSMASMAADVAVDTYANRKATRARPQDKKQLSPKQKNNIKHDNQTDLRLFQSLEQRVLELYAFKSCGVENVRLDKKSDRITPLEDMGTPQFDKKLTVEEQQELAKTLNFTNSPPAPRKMAM
jgi:hypothetical protein